MTVSFGVLFSLLPLVSHALETTPSAPEGTVDCFDSYAFNSVQVDVSSSVSAVLPGTPVTFSGTVTNANVYPVTDGSVFVKIFRKDAGGEAHRNGYPVVDEFFAQEGVVLPASASKPLTFEWDVPQYLPSGDYEADFYFMTGRRFNLLGLSFTDDVSGNKTPFTVKGDAPETPSFDKDAVTLNGNSYAFAAFPPHFTKDEPVNADVVLGNPSKEPRTVNLVWTLSNWSGERDENRLDRKTETVTLAPNERKSLRYVADKATGSVSFLLVEADYQDTKSFLDIRFVRDGFDEVRLNFPGITKYPVKEGEQNAIFSCLHSTNAEVVKNGELDLVLTDSFGTVLAEHTYRGDVTGAMMGVKSDFVPKTSSSTFTLAVTLRKDGQTVETYETTYRCTDIDPSLCPMNVRTTVASKATSAVTSLPSSTKTFLVLFVVFLVIPVLFVLWFLFRRRKGKGPRLTAILLFVLGASMYALPRGAEAKSTVWSHSKVPELYQISQTTSGDGVTYGEGIIGLRKGSIVNVQYGADLYDGATGLPILDGSTVMVGTVLTLKPQAHHNADISWTGSGLASDTPYGFWGINKSTDYFHKSGGLVTTTNNENIAKSFQILEGRLDTVQEEFPFVVDVPMATFSSSGTAGLSCDATGSTCTVTSTGTVVLEVSFSGTFGRFYDAYDNFTGALRNSLSECLDGTDNDKDGLIDGLDPQCTDPLNENQKEIETILRDDRNKKDDRTGDVGMGQKMGAYTLIIPKQSVSFSLAATSPSDPPTTPTVTGTGGMFATRLPFNVLSTDPDNDQLRYGFDWNRDGTVDQWMPGSGYVASGTSQTASYSWLTTGSKTFQVLAEDMNGARSEFAQKTVTISTGNFRVCVDVTEVKSGSSFKATLASGEKRDLAAYYDSSTGCSGVNVTSSAVFTSNNPSAAEVMEKTGDPNGKLLAAGSGSAESDISANITVKYGTESPVSIIVAVPKICISGCTQELRSQYCKGEKINVSNDCGSPCIGMRTCDLNWSEVSPGF